jgi:hypothetical protein
LEKTALTLGELAEVYLYKTPYFPEEAVSVSPRIKMVSGLHLFVCIVRKLAPKILFTKHPYPTNKELNDLSSIFYIQI